jgi:hypothetical protein
MDTNVGQSPSQKLFDEKMHRIHVMKQKAASENDAEAWGNADELYWLELRYNEALVIEGNLR